MNSVDQKKLCAPLCIDIDQVMAVLIKACSVVKVSTCFIFLQGEGPVGEPGAKGYSGPPGRSGLIGPKGNPGQVLGATKGLRGFPGDEGQTGPDGKKGPSGFPGVCICVIVMLIYYTDMILQIFQFNFLTLQCYTLLFSLHFHVYITFVLQETVAQEEEVSGVFQVAGRKAF